MLWGLGQSPLHASCSGHWPRCRPRPATSPSPYQAGRRPEGLRDVDPRPRRHPGPRGLVPVRGTDRHPVCRRCLRLRRYGRGGEWPRGVALIGSTGSIGRQAVDVLASYPKRSGWSASRPGFNASSWQSRPPGFGRQVALADDRPRWTCPPARPRPWTGSLLELATRDDVDLVVIGTGGVVSLGPVLAALRGGQGRGDGQQGDPGRGRAPGHARGRGPSRRGRRGRARPIRSRAHWPGCARSIRSTRPSGSAWSAKRWPASRRSS